VQDRTPALANYPEVKDVKKYDPEVDEIMRFQSILKSSAVKVELKL
jgi:hypothetical protein